MVITDGLAETVSLDAGVTGSVNLGDVTLTGANLHIGSTYGSPLDLSFSGGLTGRHPGQPQRVGRRQLRARTARC